MRTPTNAKRLIAARIDRAVFIFKRYGLRELLRRTLSKGRRKIGSLVQAAGERRAWTARARSLRVRNGTIRVQPAADARVHVILYAQNDVAAAYTSLRWLCELHVPVTVVCEVSAAQTDLMALGTGFQVHTTDDRMDLTACVAAVAEACEQEFVAVLSAGSVPMPGWLDVLLETADGGAGAVASSICSASGVQLTSGADWHGVVHSACLLERASILGALLRCDVAGSLKADEVAASDGVAVLLQPQAVLIDTVPSPIGRRVVFAPAGRSIAFFDAHAPYYDREGGGHRMWHLLRIARGLGWHVMFLSLDGEVPDPYLSQLRRSGVEVYTRASCEPLGSFIARKASGVDVAWMSRPEVAQAFLPLLRRENPASAIVYDTVDLHHVRLRRRGDVLGKGDDWESVRELELDLARNSDVVVTVTAHEKEILRAHGIEEIFIVPTLHEAVRADHESKVGRRGVLFIGSYDHEPNADAAMRLATRIMPLVRAHMPDLKLTLLGNNPSPRVRALASTTVMVPGYVAAVDPFFAKARVFAAPLRYGAGMKAKIVQAFAFGVPVVTSAVGAEGIEQHDAVTVVESDEEFAEAILRFHADDAEWQRRMAASRAAASDYEPGRVSGEVLAILERCRVLACVRSSEERSTLPVTPR